MIPTVAEVMSELTATDREAQLTELRAIWKATLDVAEREVIEKAAWMVEVTKRGEGVDEFYPRDNELWMEPRVMDRIDAGLEDKKLVDQANGLPQSDSEWLSWKVNKFISNISYRSKSGQLYLRAGKKSIALGGKDGFINFTCYGCRHFHGNHYVGKNVAQAQLVIARVLAHTYSH